MRLIELGERQLFYIQLADPVLGTNSEWLALAGNGSRPGDYSFRWNVFDSTRRAAFRPSFALLMKDFFGGGVG